MYQVEDQIKLTLRLIGANRYETSLPEVSMLPELLDANEQILGVVFGRYKHFLEGLSGHGALIATNQRILLIDRKPMFLRYEELPYEMISGLNYSTTGPVASVALETRAGDITMRTWNLHSIEHFVKTISAYISSTSRNLQISRQPSQ